GGLGRRGGALGRRVGPGRVRALVRPCVARLVGGGRPRRGGGGRPRGGGGPPRPGAPQGARRVAGPPLPAPARPRRRSGPAGGVPDRLVDRRGLDGLVALVLVALVGRRCRVGAVGRVRGVRRVGGVSGLGRVRGVGRVGAVGRARRLLLVRRELLRVLGSVL